MSNVPRRERDVVRRLATRVAEIVALPVHEETAALWQRNNDLDPVRPMVYVYQLPWRELHPFGEHGPQCRHPLCRQLENQFASTVYQWENFPVDAVVEPTFEVRYVVRSTGVGIQPIQETIPHDARGGVRAKHYECQIESPEDVEKIKSPVLTFDAEATEANTAAVRDLIGDILPVETRGRTRHNCAPWDRLSTWWNPQQVLLDLVLRPEMVHAAMERLTAAYMAELDQLEAMNLLSPGSGNYIVGQGGMGFTNELPGPDFSADHVKLHNQWGGAMAQIFSEVSPDMHEEFALAYEARFLKRFGLAYYGCCEPLDRKVDISAKHIPNLRKISMSPWTDADRGAEAVGGRFVYSFKPNPAFLATDGQWDRAGAEAEIRRVLEANAGCSTEIILKDVSTLRFEPQRLFEWCEMVMGLVRQCNGA